MKKIIVCFILLFTMGSSLDNRVYSQTDKSDALITFEKDFKFSDLSDKEKKKRYESYDQIKTSPEADNTVEKLSNIELMESDKSYDQLLKESKEEPQIIYFGFEACPYCRAFAPKLNQFAKEKDVNIHYYNVDERQEDKNFIQVIEAFNIDSVPHAFMIKDGKIQKDFLDSQSTMEEMEEFMEVFK